MGIRVSLLCILFTVLGACNNSKPSVLIEEEQYIKMVAEFQLSRAYLQVTKDSLAYLNLRSQIFSTYEVDSAAFAASHQWYEQDNTAQLARYQRARNYIEFLIDGPSRYLDPTIKKDSLSERFEQGLQLERSF